MKLRNIFGAFLLLVTLSACEMETEVLVDVNQPNTETEDITDYGGDDNEGERLPQDEIDEIEFQEEYDRAMEEAELEADSALVDELIDLEGKKKTGEAAKGSCNAIAEASTCLEYYGSFWTETQMELNCSDSGIFSLKPCEEGSIGGCNIGNGLPNDMVTWFYSYGGEPIGDSLPYAQKACDATPMSRWINSK